MSWEFCSDARGGRDRERSSHVVEITTTETSVANPIQSATAMLRCDKYHNREWRDGIEMLITYVLSSMRLSRITNYLLLYHSCHANLSKSDVSKSE